MMLFNSVDLAPSGFTAVETIAMQAAMVGRTDAASVALDLCNNH